MVEQGRDLTQDRVQWESAVEQAGDGAEQVADQFARSGLRGDVQVHGVQVHLQSEQVEIQRPEDEVQDLTGPGALRGVDRDRYLLGAVAGGVGDGPVKVPTASSVPFCAVTFCKSSPNADREPEPEAMPPTALGCRHQPNR